MAETNYLIVLSTSLLVLQTIYTLERPEVRSVWKDFCNTYWPNVKNQPEQVSDVYY